LIELKVLNTHARDVGITTKELEDVHNDDHPKNVLIDHLMKHVVEEGDTQASLGPLPIPLLGSISDLMTHRKPEGTVRACYGLDVAERKRDKKLDKARKQKEDKLETEKKRKAAAAARKEKKEKEFDNTDLYGDDDDDDDDDDDLRNHNEADSFDEMQETENPLSSGQSQDYDEEEYVAPTKRESNRGKQIGKKSLNKAPKHIQEQRKKAATVGLGDARGVSQDADSV
jgi:hypothetical protein